MAPTVTAKLGRRLTLPQAAQYLGMRTGELESLVRRGGITFHRSGPRARHYFYEQELDAYLDATRVSPPPARHTPAGPLRGEPRRHQLDALMPPVRRLS